MKIDLSFLLGKNPREVKVDVAASHLPLRENEMPDLELSQAAPRPCDSDPVSQLRMKLTGGYKVKIKKGVKRFTVFRFLLAKMLYDEGGIHLDEYIVLFELYYDFLFETDPSFQAKYGKWFKETELFFHYIARLAVFPYKIPEAAREKICKHLGSVLPTPSAYFGLRGNRNIRNSFILILNSPLNLRQNHTERYIGVGYKDKGNCRDVAIDASPSWKEVASFYMQLERLYEEFLGESLKTYRSDDSPGKET